MQTVSLAALATMLLIKGGGAGFIAKCEFILNMVSLRLSHPTDIFRFQTNIE